jgi:hypothetical protein
MTINRYIKIKNVSDTMKENTKELIIIYLIIMMFISFLLFAFIGLDTIRQILVNLIFL